MLLLGWWLIPITLFHVVPLFLGSLSWRALMPPTSRIPVFTAVWIRWIRKSINSLLPVAGVGGDVVGARLAHRRGLPGVEAAASMVVDITVGVVTQLIFVVAGAALLIARFGGTWVSPRCSRITDRRGGACDLGCGLCRASASQPVSQVRQFCSTRGAGKWPSVFTGSASATDEAIVATYRRVSGVLARQCAAACWMGRKRRRDLALDALPPQAFQRRGLLRS